MARESDSLRHVVSVRGKYQAVSAGKSAGVWWWRLRMGAVFDAIPGTANPWQAAVLASMIGHGAWDAARLSTLESLASAAAAAESASNALIR